MPDPATLAGALQALHQRDSDLFRARRQLAEARTELDDTNRGLIALHTELDDAARSAEARLAAIVRHSNDAIISMTPQGMIQTWNPGAQRLLGYSEERIVGQSMQSLLPPPAQEAFAKSLQQIVSDEHAEPHDAQWYCADGTLVDVAVTASALRDGHGEHMGFSAVAHDITVLKATQAELAAARAESEVQTDRARIARDLHDMVIQRVFGSGLALQGLLPLIADPRVVDRMNAITGELNTTIKQLRAAIFDLRPHQQRRVTSLRYMLGDLANSAKRGLRFEPVVTFAGPVDTVPDYIATHLLAVAQEALSNIIRHAHASAAEVALTVGADLVLQVTDNGCGLGPTTRSSGLVNLRERAETFGGTFDITSQPGIGTRLRWCVPLPRPPKTPIR